MRRSLTLIILATIGLVLLPATTNIGANAVPDSWTPHLWLAWPASVLLAAPMIYVEIRDRRRGHYPTTTVSDRAACDLATIVRKQWTDEASLRGLRSPEPIRIRWASTGRPVAAELWKVLDADGIGRPLQVRGNLHQVIEVFRQTSSRQLVILGEPGAGKSVLAMLFALGLPPDEPVPVLLAVSSWNPLQEDLHAWLDRRMVEEYSWLANSDVYGPDAAMRLITNKQVLPVLDGLDEMSDELRPIAVKALDRTVADRYPLVVTCRTTEYRNAVDRNGGFLAHAMVLEIQPVSIGDAVSFLTGADPRPERWQEFIDHLHTHPDGPLAHALRSPLMIDLARTVYNVPGGKPDEMLETANFPSQHDIENHLFDAFLRVTYQNLTTPPGSRPGAVLVPYAEKQARKWLRFIAGHLTASKEPEFAWWRLERAVSTPVRSTLAGILAALIFGFGGSYFGLVIGFTYAMAFGLAAGVASAFGRIREPSRVQVTFRGHGSSLLRRLTASLVVGFVMTLVVDTVNGMIVAATVAVALVTHLLLDSAPDAATAASPERALRQDRNGALLLGAALLFTFGVVPGILNDPAPTAWLPVTMTTRLTSTLASAVIGTVMGGFLFGRVGALTFGTAATIAEWIVGGGEFQGQDRLSTFVYIIVFGVGIGVLGVQTRAWGAFTLARLWLALCGRLPVRLMRFLRDAHLRGVLRQTGTMYQFRHEHLRTYITRSQRDAGTRTARSSAMERGDDIDQ